MCDIPMGNPGSATGSSGGHNIINPRHFGTSMSRITDVM